MAFFYSVKCLNHHLAIENLVIVLCNIVKKKLSSTLLVAIPLCVENFITRVHFTYK